MTNARSKKRYGGLEAQERALDRRRRLIGAAIGLYGRHGYRNTGVRAICQEAGLTERYFYESFANGEALLAAAYDEVVMALIETVRGAGADPGLSAATRHRRMLEAFYGEVRANPDAARVFLVEMSGVSRAIDRAFEEALDRFAALILDVHDPARRGAFATSPLLRRGVVGGLNHIATSWLTGGCLQSLDEVIDAALPLCLVAEPRRILWPVT